MPSNEESESGSGRFYLNPILMNPTQRRGFFATPAGREFMRQNPDFDINSAPTPIEEFLPMALQRFNESRRNQANTSNAGRGSGSGRSNTSGQTTSTTSNSTRSANTREATSSNSQNTQNSRNRSSNTSSNRQDRNRPNRSARPTRPIPQESPVSVVSSTPGGSRLIRVALPTGSNDSGFDPASLADAIASAINGDDDADAAPTDSNSAPATVVEREEQPPPPPPAAENRSERSAPVPPTGNTNNQNPNPGTTQSQSQSQSRPQNTSYRYPGRLRFHSHMVPLLSQNVLNQSSVSLPPLEEQPAPPRPNQGRTLSKDEERFEKELECGICYEVIDKPSHCGSCSARYCESCLTRAIEESKSCPSCRLWIPSPAEIKRDDKFFQNLSEPNRCRPCPHVNCMEKVKPSNIQSHDATCPFKPMTCKYHSFGCTWSGPRRDLPGHYKHGCTLNKVAPLINEFREMKSNQKKMIETIGLHLVQERQASMNVANQLLALHSKQWNLFDTFRCLYECTCQSRRFLITANVWRNFWVSKEVKARMNNFVCLVPIMVWVMKHSLKGMGYLTDFFDGLSELSAFGGKGDSHENDGVGNTSAVDINLLEMALAFCTFVLGVLFLACFVMDNRNPFSWSEFSINRGRINIKHPILRDSALISSVFLHFICAELEHYRNGLNLKGLFITYMMQIALLFHPIIQAMLTIAAEEPLSSDGGCFRTGRVLPIIQFGIIYGRLFAVFDPISVFEGIWMYLLFADSFANRISQKTKNQKLFQILTTLLRERLVKIIVLLLAVSGDFRMSSISTIGGIQECIYSIVVSRSPSRVLVLLNIVMENCIASWTQILGEKIGLVASKQAIRDLQNNSNIQYQGRQSVYYGTLCFIGWASILTMVALV